MTSQRLVGRRAATAIAAGLSGAGRTVYHDGGVRFEQTHRMISIRPPFGLEHECEYDRIETTPLMQALQRDYLVGVILMRLGGYAAGVYDGEQLVASKTGSRLVHGRNRAGGSSASRFSRRRDEQARRLRADAAATALRVLTPYASRLDRVVLGGDRAQISLALREHPALLTLFRQADTRFLAVPDPRQRVLDRLGYALYVAVVTDSGRPPAPADSTSERLEHDPSGA